MAVLVTGAAGFIGFHTAKQLLERGEEVIGLDNFNDYYEPALKESRSNALLSNPGFRMVRGDLTDQQAIDEAFSSRPNRIVHLAAQAGVRYSLQRPALYIQSNIAGTLNVLEASRRVSADHLVYASSSSVYGASTAMPFSVRDNVDHPVSLYAATKKSNELMAHAYSHLFGLPTTGLRFFTVYGPWGRPDMSYYLFTKSILERRPIRLFNRGEMQRDFTYIDDIVEGVLRVLDKPASSNRDWSGSSPDPASSQAPYRLYNIGNNKPIELRLFVAALEEAIGIDAQLELMPMQAGDVVATWADVTDLRDEFGFAPSTTVEEGVRCFVKWYREYHQI